MVQKLPTLHKTYYMKFVVVLLLFLCSVGFTKGQNLTVEDIPALVELVDGHIHLTNDQEQQLQKVYMMSFNRLSAIQKMDNHPLEKLKLIKQNQNETNAKLSTLFNGEQYENYMVLLNGKKSPAIQIQAAVINSNTTVPPKSTTSGSNGNAETVAETLDLEGRQKGQFIYLFNNHEKEIKEILGKGEMTPEIGIDLVTNILTTDFKIIDLAGRNKYEQYFSLRQQGLTSDALSTSGNQSVDINLVYQLYDVSKGLELSEVQTEQIIRLILDKENSKRIIREQNKGNQTAIRQKIKQLDNESLVRVKEILTPEQLGKFSQMSGN